MRVATLPLACLEVLPAEFDLEVVKIVKYGGRSAGQQRKDEALVAGADMAQRDLAD
ncbi:hypothetical protein [Ensifer sesbaniae]|uniref:hypothetical protein n=1 Tax=Ensifer sesbaniae TaxID=1214071 RepID=UPI001569B92B|nr:hypothetical protein [Ensifer sesbaniae]